MRSVLICHDGASLTGQGTARWLASFTDLVGIVLLRETGAQVRRRVRREIKRVGWLRFLDVLAMRAWYRAFLAGGDKAWQDRALARLRETYPDIPESTRTLVTHSANSPEAETFIRELAPDFVVARCKQILAERVFTIPPLGTWVFHAGICPQYRNAHGCFWALANDDLDNVGATVLRIDRGVDTGPPYGFFRYPFDENAESHIVISHRVVIDNFDGIRDLLARAFAGEAQPLDTTGAPSNTWGQPWLTQYLRWKRKARRRQQSS